MINLKAFINSLKLTWLRRVIISNSPWQSVLNKIKYNKFQRNIYSRKENIISLTRNVKNKVLVDVLKAYAGIQHLNHQDTETIIMR